MNKEFCNIIHIYLRHQVALIVNGVVIAKKGETPIKCSADDFEIVPSTSNGSASLLTTISQTVVIDKLSPADANTLKTMRSVLIQVNMHTANPIVIGTLAYPARIIYTQTLNRDILKIEQKQPAHI